MSNYGLIIFTLIIHKIDENIIMYKVVFNSWILKSIIELYHILKMPIIIDPTKFPIITDPIYYYVKGSHNIWTMSPLFSPTTFINIHRAFNYA